MFSMPPCTRTADGGKNRKHLNVKKWDRFFYFGTTSAVYFFLIRNSGVRAAEQHSGIHPWLKKKCLGMR